MIQYADSLFVGQGKQRALPYANAVMSMLPKTHFEEGQVNRPHESINEIHVHRLTMPQLFVPTSESRHFTREDAAQAFHETLLSADRRSQQPEVIRMEKKILEGMSREESLENFRTEMQDQEQAIAQAIARRDAKKLASVTKVKTERYEFRFKSINVNDVGRDGKSRNGVGWRYGAPHEDRKRGKVKIPTSVP